jgi:hypothetical protein
MKLVVGTTTDVYLKLFIILDRSCLLTSWDCVLRLLVLDAACEQLINHCPILLEHPSLEARLLFWLLFFLEVDFFSLFFVPECEVRFLRCIAASNLRFDDRWGLWRFLWNPIFTLPVGRKKSTSLSRVCTCQRDSRNSRTFQGHSRPCISKFKH